MTGFAFFQDPYWFWSGQFLYGYTEMSEIKTVDEEIITFILLKYIEIQISEA